MPRYILVHSTASTNSYLSRMAMMLPSGTVIHTPEQTAGRGQRGNSWESEAGKNVQFSMLLKKPAVPAAQQFYISEAVSLAVVEVLMQYADDFSIKWPNDIYYRNQKICGMLIEHSVMGNGINHSIVGVGINVNQTDFLSDAPNPISIAQILCHEVPVDEVLHKVCEAIECRCDFESYSESGFGELHAAYLSHLYRRDGTLHKFVLPSCETFEARIADVEPSGTLILEQADGTRQGFAFKEVAFQL